MFLRPGLRAAFAVAVAISALALPTTAGAFYEYEDSGSTDSYEVIEPSVNCFYENNAGQSNDKLDAIKVKKITNVHHPSSTLQKVGVRVVFWRNRPPHDDGIYKLWGSSAWVYRNANNNTRPKSFGPWTLKVPENSKALWRASLEINYYAADGTTVIGESRGMFEVYRHKNTDGTPPYTIGQDLMDGSDIGYCRTEFH